MNVAELKRIIANQKEELGLTMSQEGLIDRDSPELVKYLSRPNILAILGVRRCGKSVLANQILRGLKYAYLDFDDERLVDLEPKDMEGVMEAIYEIYGPDVEYLLFDEIQNVPRWELFVNRLRRTKRLVITGSNSNLLSGELSTHLTGRYLDHLLLPFSFPEYLRLTKADLTRKEIETTKGAAKAKDLLEKYLIVGGFPEATTISPSIVVRIYQDILIKDAMVRYGIKNRRTFGELAKFLVSNYSREMTYTNLKNISSIKNVHTVKNYVDHLCSVNLIFILEKYSPKLKVQMLSPKKTYCIDTGLANAICFRATDSKGLLMENLVAIELLRRRTLSVRGFEMFYWQDGRGEVDFVLKDGAIVNQLVQVSYDLSDPETLSRQTGSLVRAASELGCYDLSIITWDQEGHEKVKGHMVKFIPLYKWLLTWTGDIGVNSRAI